MYNRRYISPLLLRLPASFSLILLLAPVLLLGACSWRKSPDTGTTQTISPPPPSQQPPAAVPESPILSIGSSQPIRFEHILPDAGLSQSVVLDIVQDRQGFLWFATQDGLNRYDGYEFKIFKHIPNEPASLSNNVLLSMDIDASGKIWIGTNTGGLNCYDPATGNYTHYRYEPGNLNSLSEDSISAVYVDRDGFIWAGTSTKGLNRLDPLTGDVQRFQNDPTDLDSLSFNGVSSIITDSNGDLWVGTFDGGLNRMERNTGRFIHYQNLPDDQRSLSSNHVQSVYIDRQGILWVGTIDNGLNRFDVQTGGFTRYLADDQVSSGLASAWVYSLYEDTRGQFWVGTNGGGLHLLDRSTGKFTRYQNLPNDPTSLGNNSIWAIYEDSSGILWFGTFGTGLDKYDPHKEKFLHLQSGLQDPSISSAGVFAIYEDPQRILWVGTFGQGLMRVDTVTGSWQQFVNDTTDPQSISSNVIFSIFQGSSSIIWLATYNGVNAFDPLSGHFTRYPTPQLTFDVQEDRFGQIWVASGSGLLRLDPETSESKLFTFDPDDPSSISSNGISVIQEDPAGELWVGTSTAGLNRLDREHMSFERYQNDPDDPSSLSDNSVLCIFPASDGSLWIATASGLNRFNPETQSFTVFRSSDGLPSDFVYGILEDDQGVLWLSTNYGVSRFDPRTQQFKNYDRSDGLQDNEFNQGAYFQNQDGVMYFGGIHGVSMFHPAMIQDNPFIPPVVLTDFKLFNKPVEIGPDSVLPQPVEGSRQIRLDYTQDFFEIEFASLHFSAPENNQYAYILEGYDPDWNYVGNRRFANYTGVPPGEYTFRVRATNSDGIWNELGTSLEITIPPPFWQTVWFRLLLAGVLVGSASAAVWLRIRAIETQRRRLEVLVDERTRALQNTLLELEKSKDAAEAASRAKSTFLANMSHELRTPLNAILGFIQVLRRDSDLQPNQRENLEIIQRSSEHLLGLINDVLEMSKIEAGRTTLKARVFDLRRMLEGLEEMFALRADQKGLALHLEMAVETPRFIHGDDGKLRQVLMNLLGNAVKFTEKGQVTLRIEPCEPPAGTGGDSLWIRFAVEDSGPGIDPHEQHSLFEPFVQAKSGRHLQEGTGLGLSISQQHVRLLGGEIWLRSTPGQGSIFGFELPVKVADALDLEHPRAARQVVGLEPGQPDFRILVVDDQAVNRKLLRNILEPLGFSVREAANGKEAVDIWQEWEPHLIWMDMRMPVMDGYEATRRIKATTRGQATVIVALTASALEEDRAIILSEGCDDYMRKPFHEDDLFDMLARYLGVKYQYAQLLPQAAGTQPSPANADTCDDLALRMRRIGIDWLDALERATILGELEEITALAAQIASQDTVLGDQLNAMAAHYDHDQILALIRLAREKDNHATNRDG